MSGKCFSECLNEDCSCNGECGSCGTHRQEEEFRTCICCGAGMLDDWVSCPFCGSTQNKSLDDYFELLGRLAVPHKREEEKE